MPNLTYTVADFIPFTKIVSADVNSRFNDIKTLLNTTKLDDTNLQNASITRATKLKPGTANYVLINAGDGTMSEEATLAFSRGGLGFVPVLAGAAGTAVVVNDAETGLALGTPAVDNLTEAFASWVATLTAGEAITTNDAVCVALHNGTGSNVYRVFKCDSDLPDRRYNFAGFALASASVTPQIKTWTDQGALITNNVVSWSINGRAYSQTFSVDNDTTLAAIAVKIAADPDVQSAVVTDAGSNDRLITITSKGALSLNIPTPAVTAGVSQTTVVIAQTQAPVGGSVRIKCFGPLSGMSGLVVGNQYYLSGTAGAITNLPTDGAPIFVGQALSTTTLFVNKNSTNYQFSTPVIFVRSHGGSTGITAANYQLDNEHFNFTSWSAGTSDAIARGRNQNGESSYAGFLRVIDGDELAGSGNASLLHRQYNKSTWSTGTNRGTPNTGGGLGTLANVFYVGTGSNSNTNTGVVDTIDAFNGSTWTNDVTSLGNSVSTPSCFVQGGKISFINGSSSGTGDRQLHNSYNGVTSTAETNIGTASEGQGGASAISSTGIALAGTSSTTMNYSRSWNGSAWSSNIATAATYANAQTTPNGPGIGFSSNDTKVYMNGGTTASTTSTNATQIYAGTWASGTASSNSRAAPSGAVF